MLDRAWDYLSLKGAEEIEQRHHVGVSSRRGFLVVGGTGAGPAGSIVAAAADLVVTAAVIRQVGSVIPEQLVIAAKRSDDGGCERPA